MTTASGPTGEKVMCGRYVSVAERADLIELYNATAAEPSVAPPSYNVAPTQEITAVVERGDTDAGGEVHRQLRTLYWGLVPSWAKDIKIGARMINARVKTLAENPPFKRAFARRRTVIPASGYYEWEPVEVDLDGRVRKQPYYIHPADGGLLSFAGLYELWPDPDKDKDDPKGWLWSAAIITTQATGPAGEIHDRTPVVLPHDRVDAWLDPGISGADEVYELLAGIHLDSLEVRRVSIAVNNVRNNGAELLTPIRHEADRPLPLVIA
jgi:putative SOS response-associated peptidase YedK